MAASSKLANTSRFAKKPGFGALAKRTRRPANSSRFAKVARGSAR